MIGIVQMENDYISRRAAIDAFDKQFWSLLNIPICKEIRKAAKDTIRALTSEDVVEVVRCKDCLFGYRYFDVQNGETDSWIECRNPDGLNRDVSEDGYCCASIERSKCK